MTDTFGTTAFQPRNELEIELVRAAHEPALRAGFMRDLLDAEVFLALLLADGSRIEAGPDGRAIVPAGAKLELGSVMRDGIRALPVFSSPVRAQEFYRQDHVIAPDKLRDLVARHADTAFVLNPGSDYALDLDAADVAAMARGEFTAH